jgi:predicted ATPase/DNA-binding SARP family transcriptional activator
MEFRVLGPFEVIDDGAFVALSAPKQRALLAVLLLRAGATVSGHRLINDLWEQPPVSARKVLQTYISKLRRLLPDGMLLTRPTGYTLLLDPDDLDAAKFERLVVRAGGASGAEDEAALLSQALGLWSGSALEDFTDEPFAQPEIVRLESLHRKALVRRCELDLQAGRHLAVLGELEALVQDRPTDETIRGQLMLALYRSGRQADALRVFREGWRTLVDELGVKPSDPLCRLHGAILRHDPSLDVGRTAGSPDEFNAVTVLDSSRPEQVWRPRASRPRATTFVGRQHELSRLRHLSRDGVSRLITLTGATGAGKTRLAAELTSELEAQFPDGATTVDLTSVSDPQLVASAIRAALQLRPGEPEEATATVAQYLSSRKQLLVLDNFEHLLAAAGLVAELLERAAGLTVVVTSRVPLQTSRENLVPVAPLRVPQAGSAPDVVAATDAVVLFLDRARVARPGFQPTEAAMITVGELCTRLDGLPLALELAAARVDLLSPAAILARLDGQLDLLANDRAAQPERHHSLRAALEVSYDLLDPREQQVFRELSIFAGGFTLSTAEDVVAGGHPLLVDVVRSLLTANLLHPAGSPGDEPRFEMLQTVRSYGQARLDRTNRKPHLVDAHAKALQRLAQEAETELRGPDQVRWQDLVEAELPNIRQALQWAEGGGNVDVGLFTAAGLWRFWQVRGHTHEARRHVEAQLASPSGTAEARAAGHLTVAQCAFVQGDLAAVREHVAAGMEVYRSRDDNHSSAFGLMLLGASTGLEGDTGHGSSLLHEALELAVAADDSWLVASCLGYLGMVASTEGRYVEARHRLEDGLRGVRELGDTRLVGWFLTWLGRVAIASRDLVRAKRRFEEALTWARRLADAWSETWALQGLAGVAIQDAALAEAADLLVESLASARRAQSRPATATALGLLAKVAFTGGRHELAAELLGAANLVWAGKPFVWIPEHKTLAALTAESVRASLGHDQFDEHWARGRADTTDHIVADAARQLSEP